MRPGLSPGAGGLYCRGNCHCSLVKTSDAVSGTLGDAPQRTAESGEGAGVIADRGEGAGEDGVLVNIGWTDEAR